MKGKEARPLEPSQATASFEHDPMDGRGSVRDITDLRALETAEKQENYDDD